MAPLALLIGLLTATVGQPGSASCRPDQTLRYICNLEHPEDVRRIPGTKWLIVSGFANGSGLKLIDSERHTAVRWYAGKHPAPDANKYPGCSQPPEVSTFNAHGISLRAIGPNQYRLHVVNHGGRESIEVFDVAVGKKSAPELRWKGCLPMPAGLAANAVATFPDGTVLATVLTRPGTSLADFMQGRPTGGVYEWAPGARAFSLMPGTELPGNNGIETSPDGKHFYVVAFGWHSVVEFDRKNTAAPLRRFVMPDFMPDNVQWFRNGLIAAGMRLFEPACGGYRKVAEGVADPMLCHRGYSVAFIALPSGSLRKLARGGPEAQFNGVSTAVVVGNTLWLGSYQSDRLAYRPLKPTISGGTRPTPLAQPVRGGSPRPSATSCRDRKSEKKYSGWRRCKKRGR